jgi:hypothetical protein
MLVEWWFVIQPRHARLQIDENCREDSGNTHFDGRCSSLLDLGNKYSKAEMVAAVLLPQRGKLEPTTCMTAG